MELPNLIAVQKESFNRFMTEGLAEAFQEVSPIENVSKTLEVTFGAHEFGDPKHTVEECKAKDINYQAPLLTEVRFVNKETGEMKEQVVFMGDFPLMTDRGTFIINGTERVVVSQLVRSPGVYYFREIDANKLVYRVQFIPTRGAWLEFETDKRGCLVVSIDRKRKQPVSTFLRALGIAETDQEVIDLLGDSDMVRRTLQRDTTSNRDDALIELYKRQRPGEPPTLDSARALLDGLFFNQQRYDLAAVGRYKLNKKLGLDVADNVYVLTPEDIVASLRYLICLHDGLEGYVVDERDH
ncbi:MAG: DNA-directed RNA polymerase subunit beta, partial [Coriobacteriia bacterium]|nr:DNA-directed RNA polymerase subunit beta [Coriobacteriia bacterium]